MTQTEARRRIWKRMASTASADIDNADWLFEETENEADQTRLLEACEFVSVACARKANPSKRTNRR